MDQIYYNGDIITMVKETDSPEALCVKDGRIQFIGTREEAFSYRTKETELIDLNGKTLLPGFIDSHGHIVSFSNLLGTIDLQGCTDFDMIVNRLKKGIEEKKLEPGQWVIGFGYDHNCLKEKRHPDKYILDRASTEHPILVSHVSGHMGVLNSSALKQSGIDESTPDPEGGKIGRLQGSRQPDGYLEETAFTGCSSNMPAPSATQLIRQMQLAQEVYLKHGITTAQEGLAGTVEWEQLKQLAQNGELNIDVVAYADMKSSRSLMKENKKYRGTYINHLKLGGYKIFLDGSPQGRTAWMSEPYEGAEDGYSGYPIYTDGQVREYMQEAVQDHAQLLVHCNGDAAAQQMIDAYRTIRRPDSEIRPVMIHAQLVREDQLKEMKQLGMIPSFFVAHVYYWGGVHLENFGEKRASFISPAKSAADLDMVYTFHQDTPVIQPNMMETIWCAVNRVSKEGMVLGKGQRLTPYEALKGITVNAAYQYFEETEKGTLEQGKKADLTVLDKNPLKVPPEQLRKISVCAVVKEGKTLYSVT